MTFNSQDIIQEVRAKFEMMLDFVTGPEAQTATVDHIERCLFRRLLSLGAQLLLLFFVVRSQNCSRETVQKEDGQELPYHAERKRTYFSIFGKIPLWRPYFYQAEVGEAPLDAELSLGSDRYSDFLREMTEYLAVYVPYGKDTDLLDRFFDLHLSTRVLQQIIDADAVDVEAFYAQKPPPTPDEEAEILVLQADGKGVPMVLEAPAEPKVRLGKGEKRGHKKEAIVTTVYTIACAPRTPEEVVASLFCQEKDVLSRASPPPRPQNKHIWATLDGKDVALDRLTKQVAPRQGNHIQHQVALCDGCEALQSRIAARFSDFTLVLDFIHPHEDLWEVANSLLGETNEQRAEWVAAKTLQMLSGETEQVITDFRRLAQQPKRSASQREKLTKTANYFERNLPYMDYPTYLAKGWPIASGVIEGACRHFVKDRFELSGMRWIQKGAENLLHLRAVAENDDWDAYHNFRKRQRHTRLYDIPFPDQGALESLALAPSCFITTSTQDCYETPLVA
ncbi:MAG: ISKra4 family transposase [Anaerolineae bacterium]